MNNWVLEELKSSFDPLKLNFSEKFINYFSLKEEKLSNRILNASHFYATKWEFRIIELLDPDGYEIKEIKRSIENEMNQYNDLLGIKDLKNSEKSRNFIDLQGQLRFQIRWSNLHRIPKTSVLGHEYMVAILSYFLSLQMGACEKRIYNNFFTGLFHDFPEVLTRDIISPVKEQGLKELVKKYEIEQMEKKVYSKIPKNWEKEMKMFTENEFSDIVYIDGIKVNKDSDEINSQYNENKFNPRDGVLIKAIDKLSAFMEAFLAKENASPNPVFNECMNETFKEYQSKTIGGINLNEIYIQLTKHLDFNLK